MCRKVSTGIPAGRGVAFPARGGGKNEWADSGRRKCQMKSGLSCEFLAVPHVLETKSRGLSAITNFLFY